MPLLPDLSVLHAAADVIDRTAATVEADAAAAAALVDGLPWRGPRREVVAATTRAAGGVAHGQAAAERDLARALRQLAVEVEHELQVLRELAGRARRRLEDLLGQAQGLADATASAVAAAAEAVGRVVVEVVTGDPVGALRQARRLADQAADRVRRIAARLHSLPEPHDPSWRQLGPEILGWHP